MRMAGFFTEVAIFLLRRDRAKDRMTEKAFEGALKLLKDARVRIRNAQESFDNRG